jgi:hypothetical protein
VDILCTGIDCAFAKTVRYGLRSSIPYEIP